MYHNDISRPNNLRIDLTRLAKGMKNKLGIKITEKSTLNRPGSECAEDPSYNYNDCILEYFDKK